MVTKAEKSQSELTDNQRLLSYISIQVSFLLLKCMRHNMAENPFAEATP